MGIESRLISGAINIDGEIYKYRPIEEKKRTMVCEIISNDVVIRTVELPMYAPSKQPFLIDGRTYRIIRRHTHVAIYTGKK